MFKSNIEGLVIALLFVFTIFSGFKIVYDLYKQMNTAFIKYNSIYGLESLIKIVQQPVAIILLLFWIALSLVLLVLGSIDKDSFIASMSFGLFAISLMFLDNKSNIPLAYIYAIPFILITVSLMILLFSIAKFSDGQPFREPMRLSPKSRKRLQKIKNMFVAMFFFITTSLIIFSYYGKRLTSAVTSFIKNDLFDKQMKTRDYVIFVCMFFVYLLAGYTTYESREIAFLNKIRPDQAK